MKNLMTLIRTCRKITTVIVWNYFKRKFFVLSLLRLL